jgi:transcription elongation factor GreA
MSEDATEAASITVGQAFQEYLESLKPEQRNIQASFVRRYIEHAGEDFPASGLSNSRVESYAEREIKASDPAAPDRVLALKSFFQFLKKRNYTAQNFGVHIRVPRGGAPRAGKGTARARIEQAPIEMTPEGHEALTRELEELTARTPELVKAISQAREDKDFRENAPLEAAREAMAFSEQRRREIEATLKRAVIAEEGSDDRSAIGSMVTVTRLDTGKQMTYKLVGAREANATQMKISVESPVGKELLGRAIGEEVAVEAPSGLLQFRIDSITRS